MMRFRILKGLGIAGLAAIALTAFGYIVMSLWNWVVGARQLGTRRPSWFRQMATP